MIKLTRLFPLQSRKIFGFNSLQTWLQLDIPVMLLLSLCEDQVGQDKWRNHNEEGASNSPQCVWKTLGESSSKSSLFQRRNVVLGCSSDSDSKLAKTKTKSSN